MATAPQDLPRTLHFLVFDYTEDAQGHGSFDAMASAAPAQRRALEAEVIAVLDWAHRYFPDAQGPVEEGGEWDFALQGVLETTQPLAIDYQPGAGVLDLQPGPAGLPRLTLELTLTGTAGFCAALRRAFDVF